MRAFTVSITDDKGLPVEASELYEKHMKPARPDGTTLDVKKSSHKQIGKFFNSLRKAKVLEVNEKKGVTHVTKIDRNHKLFKQFEDKFTAEVGSSLKVSASSAASSPSCPPPPIVTTLWKASYHLEPLFKIMGRTKHDLLSWDEARTILADYVKKEELGDTEGTVKLNQELLSALFLAGGALKKGATLPEEALFSDLEDKMESRLQEHTSIEVANIGATVRPGPMCKIEVSLSRKGAHNVTRILNLEAYGIDVVALGDDLKRKLNCTVSLEEVGKKGAKDKLMQLQGHAAYELEQELLARYGITKAFFSVK